MGATATFGNGAARTAARKAARFNNRSGNGTRLPLGWHVGVPAVIGLSAEMHEKNRIRKVIQGIILIQKVVPMKRKVNRYLRICLHSSVWGRMYLRCTNSIIIFQIQVCIQVSLTI